MVPVIGCRRLSRRSPDSSVRPLPAAPLVIGAKAADAGPFVVRLCEGQTHFNGYPQWHGRDDTTIELMVPGDDPNPLGSLTQRLRGTRAEGHAAELARRALAWRTWRLVVPGG